MMARPRLLKLIEKHDLGMQIGDDDFVVVGGWEDLRRLEGVLTHRPVGPDVYHLPRVEMALGDDWGFSDEYDLCDHCYKSIRTSPDSYSWQPEFHLSDEGLFCRACLDKEAYLEEHANKAKLLNTALVNLEEHGLVQLDGDFEGGLGAGTPAASPASIVKAFKEAKLDVWFTGSVG